MLLGAVVQVALIWRREESDARRSGHATRISSLAARGSSSDACTRCRGGVVQRQRNRAGELREDAILLVGDGVSPAARAHTIIPSSSPEWANGATRNVRPSWAASNVGSQTWSHAFPET